MNVCISTVIKPFSHALPRSVGTGHMCTVYCMYAFVPRERSENSWEADPSEGLLFFFLSLPSQFSPIHSQALLCSPPCEMTQISGNHNFLNDNLIRIVRRSKGHGVWAFCLWQMSSSRLVGQCCCSPVFPLLFPPSLFRLLSWAPRLVNRSSGPVGPFWPASRSDGFRWALR